MLNSIVSVVISHPKQYLNNMKTILFLYAILCLNFILSAQSIFQHAYGNNRNERCQSAWQADDGGYILNGATTSFGTGDVDGLIIKTDAQGNILWSKTWGAAVNEVPTFGVGTFDNKMVFTGT